MNIPVENQNPNEQRSEVDIKQIRKNVDRWRKQHGLPTQFRFTNTVGDKMAHAKSRRGRP